MRNGIADMAKLPIIPNMEELNNVTQLSDWIDQHRAELEKEVSNRAAVIEGLLLAGDYQACHDWLLQWQEEDNSKESPVYKYNQAKTLLRCFGNAQQPLSRCCNSKANTDSLNASGADLFSQTN
ncbi:MAG TPA: hypothetical protein V6D33_16905 [Cyanophyceae cyanobacterium]